MNNFKTILLLLITTIIVQGQPISFKKEKIDIVIDENRCQLSGEYYFENKGFNNITLPIYYPFVINKSLTFPDSIVVFNSIISEYIPYKKSGNGILFNLSISPFSIIEVKIFYRQELIDRYFEYILTSTAEWKKPLESSDFKITLPYEFRGIKISYEPDSIKFNRDIIEYTFGKKNFMPDKNLIIKWEKD